MGFMTYEQIGNEIGITKQAVSINIKKAVNKVFSNITNIADTPFEALTLFLAFLNIDNNDDFKQVYKLINKEHKSKIENSPEWQKNKKIYGV